MGIREWRGLRSALAETLLFGGVFTGSVLAGIAGPASPAAATPSCANGTLARSSPG